MQFSCISLTSDRFLGVYFNLWGIFTATRFGSDLWLPGNPLNVDRVVGDMLLHGKANKIAGLCSYSKNYVDTLRIFQLKIFKNNI